MAFHILASGEGLPADRAGQCFLIEDGWDDWFSFRTMFTLVVFDATGQRVTPGSVKIGERGLRPARGVDAGPGDRAPGLPRRFEQLDEQFFSLGQDENYYETLASLQGGLGTAILVALRDCANDLELFEAIIEEPVTMTSLLRSVRPSTVRMRFHRLARGNAVLTPFRFVYVFPANPGAVGPSLEFEVIPDSQPPTNLHVLVGRNGVGKTRTMRLLALAAMGLESDDGEAVGTLGPLDGAEDDWSLSGLVSVSFSAFDQFKVGNAAASPIRFNRVTLLRDLTDADNEDGGAVAGIKGPADLANDFASAFGSCRTGPRRQRWASAVATLGNDPLFAEADVHQLLAADEEQWQQAATALFARLSSGHAIVLLTVTRLVELIDEKTLVLLDEPEGHLHPPLISAFVRALSDLLISRNGVAIVATHSPVVLQEVPRSCVWKLRRAGATAAAERLQIETFGENVGVLTREVFGLEVTTAGFHSLIAQAVANGKSFDEVVEAFEHQIGAEGLAIARSLVAQRDGPAAAELEDSPG